MELFGIVLAIPVTLITSLAYTALMLALFTRWPVVKRVAVPISLVVTALVVTEAALLAFLGPKVAYAQLHHKYTAIHFLNFLLAPPAIANLVLVFASKRQKHKATQLLASAACCWVACMTVLLGNIMIDEAIVGIDAGTPFYMTYGEKAEQEHGHLQISPPTD